MPKITVSCDDACQSDIRLAELCSKYDFDCVFYWPVEWHGMASVKVYEPLSYSQAQQIADNFEVGSHTITHRYLTRIPFEEAKYEIAVSKEMLQDMFSQTIQKFAPPRGYTNAALSTFTHEHYATQRLTKEEGLVHVHPDSGVNGNVNWLDAIKDDTREIFCHSWELDKYKLWGELEDFFKSQQ